MVSQPRPRFRGTSVAANPDFWVRWCLLTSSGRPETHRGSRSAHPHRDMGRNGPREVYRMFPFTLSDVPLISWYIGVLIFLEGLLSADNALVLALMVRHLPKPEQRRVLRYGIWGAIGFRFIAILLSAVL